MIKKKKLTKKYLFNLFDVSYITAYFLEKKDIFVLKKKYHRLEYMFRLTTMYKQLYFIFQNISCTYIKMYSVGILLSTTTNKFKFFKKSIYNIQPLVILISRGYHDLFDKLYIFESLNNSKKQYMFIKKLFAFSKIKTKFMIFKKTWAYTTRPVRRIKKRVKKLLKNL